MDDGERSVDDEHLLQLYHAANSWMVRWHLPLVDRCDAQHAAVFGHATTGGSGVRWRRGKRRHAVTVH